jgi:hypothetical protein
MELSSRCQFFSEKSDDRFRREDQLAAATALELRVMIDWAESTMLVVTFRTGRQRLASQMRAARRTGLYVKDSEQQ